MRHNAIGEIKRRKRCPMPADKRQTVCTWHAGLIAVMHHEYERDGKDALCQPAVYSIKYAGGFVALFVVVLSYHLFYFHLSNSFLVEPRMLHFHISQNDGLVQERRHSSALASYVFLALTHQSDVVFTFSYCGSIWFMYIFCMFASLALKQSHHYLVAHEEMLNDDGENANTKPH